ncbi:MULTISPECIES: DUF3080 family protein [Halomonadaceae]|nr:MULTISPECIES: DUF3080 family protein [Halomonas]
MTFRPLARVLLPVLLPLVLAGCWSGGENDARAEAYVDALAGAFGVAPEPSRIPTVEPLPRPRERRLELPELDMGLVDFLSLYGCELQVVVGERTSVLGRVAHPGTRMEYHLRFLAAVDACLPKIDSDSRTEALKKARDARVESLPLALWNGAWGSDEMAELVSRSGGRVPEPVPEQALDRLIEGLSGTASMLASVEPGRVPEGLPAMTERYRQWRSEPRFGQLLRSAEALQARLGDSAGILERALASVDGCPMETGAVAFYREHYLEGLAPRVQRVRHYGRRMARALEALVEATGASPPGAMTPFIERNLRTRLSGSVWHDLDRAVERHARAWNRLLARCD